MKIPRTIQIVLTWAEAFGFEPLKTISAIRNTPVTLNEQLRLRRENSTRADRWQITLKWPNFTDRQADAGTASGQYFHQDLLVAQKIFARNPVKHVDIGSRVDGFVAHVAVFREIEVFDIRPIHSTVKNIVFRQMDMRGGNNTLDDYCDSLSCLHALEHFGLGRYGDPIDIDGYKKGFEAMTKMLKQNGIFYLSIPIGDEKIDFNSHRIFSVDRVLNLIRERFAIISFSYVDDLDDLHENVELTESSLNSNFGVTLGCGIFELQKI